jgi:hypothetical protein
VAGKKCRGVLETPSTLRYVSTSRRARVARRARRRWSIAMEVQSSAKSQNPVVRQLASLKVLSRLLGHELHAQGASKTITLSREELIEIQTTVDLFIEDITRAPGPAHGDARAGGRAADDRHAQLGARLEP